MKLVYESLSKNAISLATFAGQYEYDTNYDQDRDRVVDVAKNARDNKLRIHELTIEGEAVGFIGLSIHRLENKPCLFLDYVFVSKPFRATSYPELNNASLGEQLLAYAYEIAKGIGKAVPVRYLALEPANKKLANYYKRLEFRKLDKTDFMFSKIKLD